MSTTLTLSNDLITHFKISEYSLPKKGGQKTVFYVKIGGPSYALKVVKVLDDRFKRELEIYKKFHDNSGIPKIIRVENYRSEIVILEEYIDGYDLSDVYTSYMNQERKICKLLYSICEILTPIWKENYVHRDLKPQNIRIRENGEPVVLDFGIARALDETTITLPGTQPLSYFFSSPEQYAGNKKLISYRTDFFSLGIIGFYLFTNRLPFGTTVHEINNAFLSNNVKIKIDSVNLEKFCNSVFKINPSERPRTSEILMKYLDL